jgi:molecular chaperone GrpE (heat shock protein)
MAKKQVIKTQAEADSANPEETESTVDETVEDATPETASQTDGQETAIDLTLQLAEAQEEAARNLDNWQRSVAELANFKRRKEEQMKLQRDRIKSEVLEGVISALDDMGLAFQNLPEELDGQLVG